MTEVVSVRFRSGCKSYFFNPKGERYFMGEQLVVETSNGPEFVTCTQGNHDVDDSMIVEPFCEVLRKATESDRRTVEYNRKRESEAFDICEKKIENHGLEMKLVNVNISFDGSKIIFFFTAEGRVDFRELVRDLASVFRARIELRQIGVRDEAKMCGGLGICGRPFCCSQFLNGFMPVSIKMAKTQNLSLNPTKISGTCGRLMCCLKYEQDAYEDAVSRMPKQESFVLTPDGPGNVKSLDLLKEKMKVALDSAPETLKTYHIEEVEVLRNGKGSRDGIEIPSRLPDRYVEEKKEDLAAPVAAVSRFETSWVEFPSEEAEPVKGKETEKKEEHSSHRNRRNGRRDSERHEVRQNAKPEEKHVKAEIPVVKVESEPVAEKEEAAEHHTKERSGRNHRRNRRPHRSNGPKTEQASSANAEVKAESKSEGRKPEGKRPEKKRPENAKAETDAAPVKAEGKDEERRPHRNHYRRRRGPRPQGERPNSGAKSE